MALWNQRETQTFVVVSVRHGGENKVTETCMWVPSTLSSEGLANREEKGKSSCATKWKDLEKSKAASLDTEAPEQKCQNLFSRSFQE